ncbi:ribonuclease P protein component [Mucilaginibacter psychrotolerans]|uniref:Ribonuclease P protein component n=1 Tax=Mucilaginibacter psychrotolerans TaxID=1524096 RepID=A0A4Y8S861_9SPHI|nr:ribonuclease P protein component [Mucilaginibacter psychrotolerans]TFF34667.1 ribonuclease P protein component [Mucilaginibacter psychrotolerans]
MHTFKKEERLCNKKLIDGLFHNGSSFLCYPFRASWKPVDNAQEFPVQVVFSVSKKRYKRAVDRNVIKRRMREAYRLNKQAYLYNILGEADKRIVLSIGFIGKEMADYALMEKKMLKLLAQLGGQVIK